jgi:hypothetical protein
MKRLILLATCGALLLSGCARVFPGMTHHAAAPKQPAAHVATKTTSTAPAKTPAPAPAKPAAAHKS